MRTTLLASLSAIALLAGPTLAAEDVKQDKRVNTAETTGSAQTAQSQQQKSPSGMTQSQSGQSQSGQSQSGQQAAAPAGVTQGVEMLGKKVKLEGGQQVGEITDVLVQGGKPSQAVIELDKQPDRPVIVSVTELSPQGGDYMISMTEADLAQAPQHQEGQQQQGMSSLKEQQAQRPGATGQSGSTGGSTGGGSSSGSPQTGGQQKSQ